MKNVLKASDNNYIFQCSCGSHLLYLRKDIWNDPGELEHSLEIWEYRGETKWGFWKRLQLAFRILIGKEAKHPTTELLIHSSNVPALVEAIESLNS